MDLFTGTRPPQYPRAVIENVKVAVVGVGNNTSALVQGISFYRNTGSLVGIPSRTDLLA